MLKLHGFATSQYFNKVKFALLEKGLPFEEVLVWAGEADLGSSPMGKVPYVVTPHGPLCESGVVLDYLEQQYPQIPLLPVDAYQAAKVRELAVIIDLHIELVARSLYPEAFFGGTIGNSTKETTAPLLEKGIAALQRLAHFEPFVAGDMLSLADCSAVVHLPVVAAAGKAIYDRDFFADLPIDDYLLHMAKRPSLQKINADRQVNMALLFARMRAKR